MITIKTKKEIEILKEGGKILAEVLKELVKLAKPGVSTGFLDQKARGMILSSGGEPAFLNYHPAFSDKPYPFTLCASLNEVVVHGLPGDMIVLKEGDILKLDLGVKYKNLFTDSALTIGIGNITTDKIKLIEVTKASLDLAIEQVKPGNYIGDIGRAVEGLAKSNNFSVVKILVGHGVGYAVHEEPSIPNYEEKDRGPVLKTGMVLAIEPMLTMGSAEVKLHKDGFGYETIDGSLSAHFEHTVVVTDVGSSVLTTHI